MISRQPLEGMGLAVARRTVFREDENWLDVSHRVSEGNCSLHETGKRDFLSLRERIAEASILMSGRHLQHGDSGQSKRPLEVYSNCCTAATSFMQFNLLLNGAGVGRAYDDNMMLVNWDFMPKIRAVLSLHHPDYSERYDSAEAVIAGIQATQRPGSFTVFEVEDSREGWAKAMEILEVATWRKIDKNKTYIFDFSKVRPEGSPIGGMQDRPSSGPVPYMKSLYDIFRSVRGRDMSLWKQGIFVDHFLAKAVLVGGARRAARIGTKYWKDEGAFEFCTLKADNPETLWSANYSLAVDAEFWEGVRNKEGKAWKLFLHATKSGHLTGEPGFVNYDRFSTNLDGIDVYKDGDWSSDYRYKLEDETKPYHAKVFKAFQKNPVKVIPNPCGEISLLMLLGYCVIADLAPYHLEKIEDFEVIARLTARALIRTNLMNAIYRKEIDRTNRIGVGLTGIHEFAWKFFEFDFDDLIDEEKSQPFWDLLKKVADAVDEECEVYSKELGVTIPHTTRTIKPAGTTSKLFHLTEGIHLPPMREYIRWVQFKNGDPLIDIYREAGYAVKQLKVYNGMSIVGFPHQPEICKLGMNGNIILADEATPEQQYRWLMLIEKYWLSGDRGNQASYTLKYDPEVVSLDQFRRAVSKYQPEIKCCSVMPKTDVTIYEYEPEQAVTKQEFQVALNLIKKETVTEDVSIEALKCDNGACPL